MLDSCRALETEGFRVTYLPVNSSGLVTLDDLEKAIDDDTSLVSIMTVNNEIGVKQPISEIGNAVIFHLRIFRNNRERVRKFGKSLNCLENCSSFPCL